MFGVSKSQAPCLSEIAVRWKHDPFELASTRVRRCCAAECGGSGHAELSKGKYWQFESSKYIMDGVQTSANFAKQISSAKLRLYYMPPPASSSVNLRHISLLIKMKKQILRSA